MSGRHATNGAALFHFGHCAHFENQSSLEIDLIAFLQVLSPSILLTRLLFYDDSAVRAWIHLQREKMERRAAIRTSVVKYALTLFLFTNLLNNILDKFNLYIALFMPYFMKLTFKSLVFLVICLCFFHQFFTCFTTRHSISIAMYDKQWLLFWPVLIIVFYHLDSPQKWAW